LAEVAEEEGEMGRGVGNGLAGEFEAAAVGEDEGEGLWGDGGRHGSDVDFEEGSRQNGGYKRRGWRWAEGGRCRRRRE
jgi:hypothetical protein